MVKKKLAVLGLAAVMTVAFMPAMAFAETTGTAGNTSANAAQTTSTVKDLTNGGALNSGSYKLTADLTEGITVAANQEVTLDLNGHNINANSGDAIVNKGTLTINDSAGSASVHAQGETHAAIANLPDATCIVNGGTYSSDRWYVLKNLGSMTIEGNVSVNGTAGNVSSLIDNGWASSSDTVAGESISAQDGKASLTIKGGNFNGRSGDKSCSVVKNDDYGTLQIDGGVFDSTANNNNENAATILNWNVAVINDGLFKGQYTLTNGASGKNTADKGQLTVNGGTFENTSSALGYSNQNIDGLITINGGTFKKEVNNQNGNLAVKVNGGSFDNDVTNPAYGVQVDSNIATATVTNGTSTTYAVGEKDIQKAAEDSSNTVTITKGSVSLTGANAKIVNATSNNTGTVTVDGTTVKAGGSVQPNAAQTIANLKSEIASLKSQLAQAQASASTAQSTSNDSARQITQLKKDLADAQAQLKAAQEQVTSQGSTLTAPAKVMNLKVKAGKKSAKLSWTALKDNATGYRIYRKTKGGKYAKVKTITKASTASWTNKGLKKGKTYYYKVRAYKSITSGELWGTSSNTAKAKVK
jgi:ribosomal protein L29